MSVNQIDLFSAICMEIDRQGVKTMTARQNNSVIEAANIVVAAFDQKHRPVTDGMGLDAWRGTDEVGMSSEFMASVLSSRFNCEYSYPHDSEDFGRCLGLLRAVPEFKSRIHEMKQFGTEWNVLLQVWSKAAMAYEAGDKKECSAIIYKAVTVGITD